MTVATTGAMRQLVHLRWIAVAGQLVTILGTGLALGVPLPLVPMLLVVASLAAVNLLTLAVLPRHGATGWALLLALLFDMGSLTVQLYLSGGASNPFVTLYLLQIALAAILLRPVPAWIVAATAAGCYALLGIRNWPLLLPTNLLPLREDMFALGRWLGFALVATLLVVFITRISRTLREQDAHLAELRRRAAEEDGIVRIGLFASGAAHELGTPLASISVILADWRRLPRVVADPDLAGEIEEMQAEVRRCKAIVTDILHSAGQPRGETLAARPARLFLAEVIEAWRLTRPDTGVVVKLDELDRAMLVTDPALRQAIGSLLDNAAEASPGAIEVHGSHEGDELVVAISDHGPGFAPGMLAAIGRPLQSIKGAGHGMGIFLASNVARRLGGRLEAANRGRGAEVRLVLPAAVAHGADR